MTSNASNSLLSRPVEWQNATYTETDGVTTLDEAVRRMLEERMQGAPCRARTRTIRVELAATQDEGRRNARARLVNALTQSASPRHAETCDVSLALARWLAQHTYGKEYAQVPDLIDMNDLVTSMMGRDIAPAMIRAAQRQGIVILAGWEDTTHEWGTTARRALNTAIARQWTRQEAPWALIEAEIRIDAWHAATHPVLVTAPQREDAGTPR